MADKRAQFSISQRYSFRDGVKGEWLISQAVWRDFDDGKGGYWSFEHGEDEDKNVVWRDAVSEADDESPIYPPQRVRDAYEKFIEYDPSYDEGSQVNLVEMISDEEGGFDQPCMFGNRVDGHAVYCHNSKWLYSPRKCRRTWYTGGETRDEDCEGYTPNPNFKPTDQ